MLVLKGHLPLHQAACEGHYLAPKYLNQITSKHGIWKCKLTPIHSTADGLNWEWFCHQYSAC